MDINNEVLNKIIDDILSNITLVEKNESRHREGEVFEYPLYYDNLKHEWHPIKDWVLKNEVFLALTDKINERINLIKQK